jgi:hypothetical protein
MDVTRFNLFIYVLIPYIHNRDRHLSLIVYRMACVDANEMVIYMNNYILARSSTPTKKLQAPCNHVRISGSIELIRPMIEAVYCSRNSRYEGI